MIGVGGDVDDGVNFGGVGGIDEVVDVFEEVVGGVGVGDYVFGEWGD